MSFNLWSDSPKNRRWQARRELIAAILQSSQPHLIGLQEVTHQMLLDVHDRFPHFEWIGVARDDGKRAGEFNPIFFLPARFELLEQGTFWLAPQSEEPGRGWDARCLRIVTWARMRDLESGKSFAHFNTHFDHFGRRARIESAMLLLRKIQEVSHQLPVIVTGDFNCRPGSAAYSILTGEKSRGDGATWLEDSLLKSKQPPRGPKITWLGFAGFGRARLDYVFVSQDLQVLQHEVVESKREASDHLPVLAEVALS